MLIEQVADVAGAGIEAGGGEEVGRIVECAVDLLPVARRPCVVASKVSGALQGEQVLADCRGRGCDVGQSHGTTFLVVTQLAAFFWPTPEPKKQRINEN